VINTDRPLLRVEGLTTLIRAGGNTIKAVDDVSFTIEKGETYCLVGESGSGKSMTALSIIQLLPEGLCSHPSGQIFFDYRDQLDKHHLVDMLTLVIIGSSQSRIFETANGVRVYTPRGYAQKGPDAANAPVSSSTSTSKNDKAE